MKTSEQRQSEARRQHSEAIVARHLHELFQRLAMLSGFWLGPELELAELSVFSWPGYTAGRDLYEEVMQSLRRLDCGASATASVAGPHPRPLLRCRAGS